MNSKSAFTWVKMWVKRVLKETGNHNIFFFAEKKQLQVQDLPAGCMYSEYEHASSFYFVFYSLYQTCILVLINTGLSATRKTLPFFFMH